MNLFCALKVSVMDCVWGRERERGSQNKYRKEKMCIGKNEFGGENWEEVWRLQHEAQ